MKGLLLPFRLGRAALMGAAMAVVPAAVLLPSCKTAPLAPDAMEEAADALAMRALPSRAAIHALVRPGLLPALAAEVLSGMDSGTASRAGELLRRTRTAYIALDPPLAGERGAFYALLSGKYAAASLRAALASAKGALKKKGYSILEGGTAIAVPSSRYVLVTNADMESFLSRLESPGTAAEDEVHPLGSLAEEDWNAPRGIRMLCADPAALILPPALAGLSELPLVRIEMEASEAVSRMEARLSFSFDSENAARVFLPAARMLGFAAAKALGGDAGSASALREGKVDAVEGIALPLPQAAVMLLRLAVGRR